MFDVKSITTTETGALELMHPETGEPLGARIILVGPEDAKRKRLETERLGRSLQLAFQGRRGKRQDPDEAWDKDTEYLVACTVGWEGIAEDGKPIAFSSGEARKLYANPKLGWLRRAVDSFLQDPLNFIKSSAQDSSGA